LQQAPAYCLEPLLYKRDVEYDQCSALFWAARNAQVRTAELSLDARADINIVVDNPWPYSGVGFRVETKKTPFLEAFQHRFYGGSALPVDIVPDLEPAAIARHDDMMIFLVSRGANVSLLRFYDYCGWSVEMH
jgi:hypothetical protein